MLAHVIWQGKTSSVLPAEPPANMLSSVSESHWTTAKTLHDMLDFAGRKLGGGPDKPCVFIIDCAPGNISKEFLQMPMTELPWIRVAYVAPNHTAFSQPLNVAHNRVLQEAIHQRCVKYMARDVLSQDIVGTTPTFNTRLTTLRQPFTTWVSEALVAVQDRGII